MHLAPMNWDTGSEGEAASMNSRRIELTSGASSVRGRDADLGGSCLVCSAKYASSYRYFSRPPKSSQKTVFPSNSEASKEKEIEPTLKLRRKPSGQDQVGVNILRRIELLRR